MLFERNFSDRLSSRKNIKYFFNIRTLSVTYKVYYRKRIKNRNVAKFKVI